ncbi:MAG: invasion associated locus B family protein [Alphaproteobacteria bacterium]|nr:invasion associated locus B family protein [Alphaproteobacteria bacterium]
MKKILACIIVLCSLVSVKSISMSNSEGNILGTFGTWTSYVFHDGTGKVCYMAAQPIESKGKYTSRDDVFLTITHRSAEKTYDVVSMTAGFTYQKSSKPSIRIDKKKAITLIPVADMAWAKDDKTDAALVKDMIAGSNAYVNGTSKRGTKITDTFSLKGFSKAYNAINEACGR